MPEAITDTSPIQYLYQTNLLDPATRAAVLRLADESL
jgi:hypothetical protein